MNAKSYLSKCKEVIHTTLDPEKSGAVRIHLIPPKKLKPGIPWVVILNGYSILPLQTSWAILLSLFINNLNETDGKALNTEEIKELVDKTINDVKLIYKKIPENVIKDDLNDIVNTLLDVSKNKEPSVKIGYMTLSKYSKYMNAPHRMDLMISSMVKNNCWNCNQKCIHCYAKDELLSNVEELSTNEWKKIIDKCKKSRIPALTFTGGEPTMRKDLVELVEYSKWFVTRLNTNGILLTKDLCTKLKEASLDSVQVTLYSFDENIHNTLVGANHFKDTINGIKNAIEVGLDVSINTPLCSINKDYLSTIKFAHELGVHYFSSSGLIPTGEATTDKSIATRLSNDEMLGVIKNAYSYTSKNHLELAFTSPGFISEAEFDKMRMVTPSCGACLSNMAIAPNGEVIPCQSWLFEDGLGNMLNNSWEDIWNSDKCASRRKKSAKYGKSCPLHEVRK